jgi:hypothetical protein
MQNDKRGEPQPGPEEPLRPPKQESLIPAVAVAAVVVAALAAAIMVKRGDSVEPQTAQGTTAPTAAPEVVKAPPLKAAPATSPASPAQAQGDPHSGAGSALGAGTACRNCGVVEMVVAIHGHAKPKASGYQMHIRMDDGSVRTVEQRGALAAGSRVMVEGASVRALSTGQG